MIRLFSKRPRLTKAEAVASAASYLAKHAAHVRADARKYAIRRKCFELREGPVVPITPREINIANVRRASH